MNKQRLCILGSTGSIGDSTLKVVRQHADKFIVHALVANQSVESMLAQIKEFNPAVVVMADEKAAASLAAEVMQAGLKTEVLQGEQAACDIAADISIDTVMAAMVGASGLRPTLAAINAGKRVLLANKESLVMAGALMMNAARGNGADILPVDSEHNAIFQCLPIELQQGAWHEDEGLEQAGIEKIILTASGGPFRGKTREQLMNVTPEQACAHPNWSMGAKISVDSASLMNKGLELIEACWLFAATADEIDVVVHPQSIVHSMVQYVDGSVLAQLGAPDMQTPIAYCLSWPERIDTKVDRLDWKTMSQLNFEEPDLVTFPALRLAKQAAAAGGTAPAILNAANEVAVSAFLQKQLAFLEIPMVVEETLDVIESQAALSLDIVVEADRKARECAQTQIARLGRKP